MNLKLGTELNAEDQAYVLRAYVHRFTGQHKPTWARKPRPDGSDYPVQFKDDQDWLAHTEFYVTPKGRLDRRQDLCFSHATWPNNPELR